jgi:uncharacterized protein YutE (UPF0331/DUF86 family)
MVDRGGDTAPRRAALEHLLGARLETQRLDVVWISQAPVDLAFAIISQGRLIYESDVATRVEFEAQIMSRYFDYLPVLRAQRAEILAGGKVALEFSGIERRLDELSERLGRLEPLRAKSKPEFAADPYLRDIAERNLEVAAQCVLDIAHRLISLTGALKPRDYYEAILRLGELRVLSPEFAAHLAPLAGFCNILVHEYLQVNWAEVYRNLQQIDDLVKFGQAGRQWLRTNIRNRRGGIFPPPHSYLPEIEDSFLPKTNNQQLSTCFRQPTRPDAQYRPRNGDICRPGRDLQAYALSSGHRLNRRRRGRDCRDGRSPVRRSRICILIPEP